MSPQTNRVNVLIIEDADIVLHRIEDMLREVPCVGELYSASDHDTALKIISEKKPHVVLADIHLPDKSGIDILRYIKENHPEIKVVMVSNKATDYYRRICGDIGSHGFIDKSKEFEKIPDLISEFAC